MKFWQKLAKATEAAEIAEMAMVLPVMFLTFLGIFWMGRAYNIYAAANQAAREGARVAVAPTCATCGSITCGGVPGPYACDTTIENAIKASLQADHLDLNSTNIVAPASNLTSTFCGGGSCTTTSNNVMICRNASLTPAGVAPQECGVMIGFQYKMLSTLPMLNAVPGLQNSLQNMNISARAQMRAEQ